MTRSNPPNFSRQILLLAASIFLLAAPQGALAKHKDHSDDHGGMSSNDSNDDHGDEHSEDHKDKNKDHAEQDMKSDKHKGKHKHDEESAENGMSSDKHKGKHKHDEESAESGMDSEKHKGKDKDHAEKTTDTEQDKTTGTASPASGNTPTADGDLFRKGVVGQTPTDIKPIPATPAPGAVPGPAAVNTIHPIVSPPPRVVTISVGGGSFQMYDGPGGMTVTSHHPGQLTISNGVQTQTLSGIKVTISGSAGVAVAKGLGVGRPDTPGSVVVLSPNGTVTGGPQGGSVVGAILDTLNPPFEAHAETPTSAIQKQ